MFGLFSFFHLTYLGHGQALKSGNVAYVLDIQTAPNGFRFQDSKAVIKDLEFKLYQCTHSLCMLKHWKNLVPLADQQHSLISNVLLPSIANMNTINQSSDILQHSQNRTTGDRWLKF